MSASTSIQSTAGAVPIRNEKGTYDFDIKFKCLKQKF